MNNKPNFEILRTSLIFNGLIKLFGLSEKNLINGSILTRPHTTPLPALKEETVRFKKYKSHQKSKDIYINYLKPILKEVFFGYRFKDEEVHSDTQIHQENIIREIEDQFNILLLLTQRDCDADFLFEIKTNLAQRAYLTLLAFSSGIKEKQMQFATSCPFLYVEKCIEEIISNELNISKSIRSIGVAALKELDLNLRFGEIDFYNSLKRLDGKKNTTITLQTLAVSTQNIIKLIELRNLPEEKIDSAKRMLGLVHCMTILSNFANSVCKTLGITPESFYELLSNTQKELRLKNNSWSTQEHYNFIYRCLWHQNSDKKKGEKLYFDRYDPNKRPSLFFISLVPEYFDLETIRTQFSTLKTRAPEVKLINSCIAALISGDIDSARSSIDQVFKNIASSTYSIKKIISMLHIGIKLVHNPSTPKHSLKEPVRYYLDTSFLGYEFYDEHTYEENAYYIEITQDKNTDLDLGLCRIIKEYNTLVTKSCSDWKRLIINPLVNIESFLFSFTNIYKKQKDGAIIEKSIDTIISKIEKKPNTAIATHIQYDVRDIMDDFMIDRLGFSSLTHHDKKSIFPGIYAYIELSDDERLTIRRVLNNSISDSKHSLYQKFDDFYKRHRKINLK